MDSLRKEWYKLGSVKYKKYLIIWEYYVKWWPHFRVVTWERKSWPSGQPFDVFRYLFFWVNYFLNEASSRPGQRARDVPLAITYGSTVAEWNYSPFQPFFLLYNFSRTKPPVSGLNCERVATKEVKQPASGLALWLVHTLSLLQTQIIFQQQTPLAL